MSWIQTRSGKRVHPLSPTLGEIDINDIAHALSQQCRWSGHTSEFYSVAQHSVLVSIHCDSKDALWGLLHDASEAYLVDLPRPIKPWIGGFERAELNLMISIADAFDLPYYTNFTSSFLPESVRVADDRMMCTEAVQLMAPLHPDFKLPADPYSFRILPWSPAHAKKRFLERFKELTT